MHETKCPKCTYICDILAQMCDEHLAEWEGNAEATIKARHAQPVDEDEIKRLQEVELAAEKVYRNRHDILNDPTTAYGHVMSLGRALKAGK